MLTAGESQYELIPIDHGFALPEAFEPPYFEWQHWPQVRDWAFEVARVSMSWTELPLLTLSCARRWNRF